ncbi:hypothetical protein NMD1_01413 [Novosphingobium sp. MD-1]|nr:hypothetical protein NMD1_01413 [Novosphingobium sp. MD-1]
MFRPQCADMRRFHAFVLLAGPIPARGFLLAGVSRFCRVPRDTPPVIQSPTLRRLRCHAFTFPVSCKLIRAGMLRIRDRPYVAGKEPPAAPRSVRA